MAARKTKLKIFFDRGYWWFCDPNREELIHVDPLFWKSGWRVDELCALLGVGKRTFGRVMEESLGITPKQWLREIRIVIACHLLREGHKIKVHTNFLNIGEEADFTHEFKKLIGVTPSFFRQSEHSRAEGYLKDEDPG